jgi:hypothetical protein
MQRYFNIIDSSGSKNRLPYGKISILFKQEKFKNYHSSWKYPHFFDYVIEGSCIESETQHSESVNK